MLAKIAHSFALPKRGAQKKKETYPLARPPAVAKNRKYSCAVQLHLKRINLISGCPPTSCGRRPPKGKLKLSAKIAHSFVLPKRSAKITTPHPLAPPPGRSQKLKQILLCAVLLHSPLKKIVLVPYQLWMGPPRGQAKLAKIAHSFALPKRSAKKSNPIPACTPPAVAKL